MEIIALEDSAGDPVAFAWGVHPAGEFLAAVEEHAPGYTEEGDEENVKHVNATRPDGDHWHAWCREGEPNATVLEAG